MLVLWVLSYIHLPSVHPDQPVAHFWFAGTIATLLFFASVLAHELSHSLVARALGLEVLGITLFIFGGVSRLATDPKDAWTEIKVAIAGPLMSFFLGGFFFALFMITAGPLADSPLVPTVFGYLAFVNFALGAFNLVPGFPLDGGRVLRAVLWLRSGSVIKATRAAARSGKLVATLLMILGVVQVVLGGDVGGFWLVLIGFFLRTAAGAAGRDAEARHVLEGVRVGEVMQSEPVWIPAETSVEEAAEQFFLRHGFGGFPVGEEGEVRGMVSLAALNAVPAERRGAVQIRDVMTPLAGIPSVGPGDPVRLALERMGGAGVDRLPVFDSGNLVGLITQGGIQRFLRAHRALDRPER